MAHRDQHNFDLSAHFLICLPLNNAVSLKVGLDLPPQVAVRYPATAKNMTQVLHISDIHFEEESADQDSVLAALKHSIQKLTFDVVVVSGISHGQVQPHSSNELRDTLKLLQQGGQRW